MEVLFSRYGSYRLEKELQFLFGSSLRALGLHTLPLSYTHNNHSCKQTLMQTDTHAPTLSFTHTLSRSNIH